MIYKDKINIKQNHAMRNIAKMTHTTPIRLRNCAGYLFLYEPDLMNSFIIADEKIINPDSFYGLMARVENTLTAENNVINEALKDIG